MVSPRKTTYGGRPSMSLEDRAKIFSPFDPLQGFREALRQVEREVENEMEGGGTGTAPVPPHTTMRCDCE